MKATTPLHPAGRLTTAIVVQLSFGLALFQFGCGSAPGPITMTAAGTVIPADVTYKIEKIDMIPSIKRSLDVRLSRPVSEDILRAIAIQLKNSDQRVYDRTFISYYLPGMEIGSGGWATSHFDPDLKVSVNGLLVRDEATITKALLNETRNPSRRVIGRWLDETSFGSGISLYRENGVIFLYQRWKDGSSRRVQMVKLGQRFKQKESDGSGDYFQIDQQGNLQVRDQRGLILTAKRVR